MMHLEKTQKDRICFLAAVSLSLLVLFLMFSGCSIKVDSDHYPADASSPVWSGIQRIVAVADIHGDFDNFREILMGTELIDSNLNWTGGRTHLVQMGDIMDRGPNAKKVLELLMKLEKQASGVGGKVHILLGNHEESNIIGIALDNLGYVSSKQFASFLPERYRAKRENAIRTKFKNGDISSDELEQKIDAYWSDVKQADKEAMEMYYDNFYQKYGKWLLEKNLVIKINDIVFTHGGISEKFSIRKLRDINSRARREMRAFVNRENMSLQIVYQSDAPHWNRDLILNDEEDYSDDVDRILENLNARCMVVGHTVRTKEVINSRKLDRFNGSLWGMDTGISKHYGSHSSALIIKNGRFEVWWKNEK